MAKINNLAFPGGGGVRTPCPPPHLDPPMRRPTFLSDHFDQGRLSLISSWRLDLHIILNFIITSYSLFKIIILARSLHETGQSVGGSKMGELREKPPGTPTSRISAQRGARTQTQR